MTDVGPGDPTQFDQQAAAQLELYAREMHEMFRQERSLRKDLEKEKLSLEQRLRELMALNRTFQEYLQQHYQTQEAYTDLMSGMRTLIDRAEGQGLAAKTTVNNDEPRSDQEQS